MRWKPTWLLLALTVLLFAFIYFVERNSSSSSLAPPPPPRLLGLNADRISGIKLKRTVDRTNTFNVWFEKTNQGWNLTLPRFYPAQTVAVQGLLQALATLTSQTYITPQELASSRNSLTNFGLDDPAAALTLHHDGGRTEIYFGAKTSVGDHIYVQLLTKPGIYVVSTEVFDRLPRSADEWRDPYLLNLAGLSLDRMEVRASGRGFAIQENQTNHTFYLSKPQVVRANDPKIRSLLKEVQLARVAQFVSDDPRADLEPFGLQPPQAELAFGNGTNDVLIVQFGSSPTNAPSLVYARRLAQTNVVLVAKSVLEALLTPHTDLRDRHLVSFSPAELDTIEVTATPQNFTLHLETNGVWMVANPPAVADAAVMRDWLADLERLEGNVEKDVVTDFAPYALAAPARTYTLKASVTNTTGLVTNRVLSQLLIGGATPEKVFVRRSDENSVYSIAPADLVRLPWAPWQLRDRRVWSFTSNQVSRVTFRQSGITQQWDRSPTGQWRFAPGFSGIIDDRQQMALEETMFRLGELRAVAWVAKGEEERSRYGFSDDGLQLGLELRNADKTSNWSLEFGGLAPANEGSSSDHYALAKFDGQSWVFQCSFGLYKQVVQTFRSLTSHAAQARQE